MKYNNPYVAHKSLPAEYVEAAVLERKWQGAYLDNLLDYGSRLQAGLVYTAQTYILYDSRSEIDHNYKLSWTNVAARWHLTTLRQW